MRSELPEVEENLRRQTRAFRALQRIAVAANQAPSVEEALRLCVAELCEHTGWPVGHVLRRGDDDPPHLVTAGIWFEADPDRTEPLRREARQLSFEAGVGLPGRVLRSRQIEWIRDLAANPAARRAEAAAQSGLTTGVAFPVLAEGEVIYVVELFAGSDVAADPLLSELLGWTGTQLGWLIKRQRRIVELEAAKSNAHLAHTARGELLESLTDELAGPLRSVVELSRDLARRAENQGRQDEVSDLFRIQAAAQQLLGSLRLALDMPSLERGEASLALTTFDVRQMIGELVGSLLPLAEATRNTIEVSCSGALGVMHSDQPKLRLCLYNLLANACRLTERGTITLGITRQRRGGGEFLVYTVSDTGDGLPTAQVAQILDAAVRRDTPGMHRHGGLGLGLALSKITSRLLFGELTAVSEPGRGSTFLAWFPADAEAWYADPQKRRESVATSDDGVRWIPRRPATVGS